MIYKPSFNQSLTSNSFSLCFTIKLMHSPRRNIEIHSLNYSLRDRTPRTERSYRIDLKDFFNFTRQFFELPRVEGGKVQFEDIRRIHVVKWKKYLETEPNKLGKQFAPNSINRKLSSVASFYRFLQQREVVDKNPVDLINRPKRVNVRDTVAFTDDEIKRFFQLVIRRAPEMHKAILLLLFTSGLRNHEIRKIKLKDFENRQGIKVLRYTGKGQKSLQMPIHPVTAYHLGKYLDWMSSKGRQIGPEDYLFQSSKNIKDGSNKMLSHTALGYIVKKWARKVNMNKRITPHSGRASVITSMLANGEDIYNVARTIGHSSTNTTARYNKRKQNLNESPIFSLKFFN